MEVPLSSHTTRRTFLAGLAAACAAPAVAKAAPQPEIHVLKDAGCGCCSAWIEILEADGFAVRSQNVARGALMQAKIDLGIPPDLASCHTAQVSGYVIEGHVPAQDIRRLLAERPDALGLSVPGMPFGSPGMGPESRREAYDVVLILRDGTAQVFTSYPAAT